jgi:dipeptidyl aminopeptidase/acylaminoacyl peptidase
MNKKVEVQDLRRIQMVTDPQITPNGKRIAFVHTTIDYRSNEYVSNIWLAELEPQKLWQLTAGRGKDKSPRWSPDGSKLLFTSSPPQKERKTPRKPQLFVINVAGGEAVQWTNLKGGIQNPRWAPTGQSILFTSLVEGRETTTSDVKVIRRVQYKFNAKGFFNGQRNHLFTISTSRRNPKQITEGAFDVDAAEWLGDTRNIVFISNLKATADLTRDKYLYMIPVSGGDPERLTDGPRTISSFSVSPKTDEIAYIGHDYRRGLASNQDLWIVSSSGGASSNLTSRFDQDIGKTLSCDVRLENANSNPQWSNDGERLFFTSAYKGYVGLYQTSRTDGEVRQILGEANHSVESWSIAKGETIAYTMLQSMAPIELWMKTENVRRQLTFMNQRWIKRREIQQCEKFTFKSAAGHRVEGWIIRPPGFKEGKKYPMILEIHGGPRGVFGYSFMHEFQVLAAQGWVIVYTNPFGSGGYEETFQAGLPGHYGEQDFTDLMEAVDYTLKHYAFIDTERLGVLGGSYGGFMTNWIVTHTDRFKAAVTMRSISNWVSFFGCSDIGWTFGQWEMGGNPPWIDEERYMAKSPIRYVQNVTTPTLIIHSENDYRCPMEQAEQFFTALKCLNVPTELIRFPNEYHSLLRIGKPKHREERLNHTIRWFKTYL